MWKRGALFVTVAGLIAALLYSQNRRPSPRVSGYVEADEIRLGSLVGGRVHEVLVEEGQRVSQGELLVQLEPFDLTERYEQASATLAQRQAEVDKLTNGFRPEERAQAKALVEQLTARLALLQNGPRQQEIDAAQRRMDAADAEMALAEQNFRRASQLLETRAMAREEYDAIQERLKSAQFSFQVRQKELELLELGTREEQIAEAQAQLAAAKAAWDLTGTPAAQQRHRRHAALWRRPGPVRTSRAARSLARRGL
jgi:multidrug resistance efflux pump